MTEFIRQGLHKKFKKEIEEWFIYLDQQEFGRKLEKQILQEIERYMSGKKTIEELIEEVFGKKKTKWEIEFIEGIKANYFFKSALGYA